MRLSGLATGMDTEQMIRDMMRVERLPVDRMMQQRQTLQWKMEDYRDINRMFNTFRTNIFDTVMLQSNMLAKSVSSSNSGLVTATANSSAGNMNVRIDYVESLARSASFHSTGRLSATQGEKVNPSAALGTQAFADDIEWRSGVVNTQSFTINSATAPMQLEHQPVNLNDMVIKANGKAFEVVTEGTPEIGQVLVTADGALQFNSEESITNGTTVSVTYLTETTTQDFSVKEAKTTFQLSKRGIDESSVTIQAGGVEYSLENNNLVTDRSQLNGNNAFLNVNTGQIIFGSAQSDISVEYAQRYMTAGINGYNEQGEVSDKFIFTANQTLTNVFTELNRSSVGVSAFYDSHEDKVIMTRTQTGVFNPDGDELTFSGFFSNSLKLDGSVDSGASNAVFSINGMSTERQSNTFTAGGMTITLNSTFENEVNLSASTDTDKVFDTIMEFVNEYNEILDFVNGKLTEDRNRSYLPLTDEQKDAMSEREIEKWEEQARSGLLRNDAILRSPLDRMRLDMYGSVNLGIDSAFNHLSAIGITTSTDYLDRGKLVVNEDKLRQAIEDDPEAIYQLFAADGESNEEKGIARRLRQTLDQGIESIAERAGGLRGKNLNHQFTLGRNINNLNDQISNFERRLQQIEQRYWRQFTAMETAIQRANSQAEMFFAQMYPQG
ncbi:flagellar filament capping protein FliD [Bacillus sp. JCM 19034]|uniref:flagellar filament capping protein FliD n=1 Tax=Bacillus sp. JCM 19034 TaxID=1481928 RepID=UPI00078261A4|nr:flagellar filament capping protein FliD [Bacillus sp. JCM 19034]